MKKLKSTAFASALCLAAVHALPAVSAGAFSAQEDEHVLGVLTYEIEDDHVIITDCEYSAEEVEIPAEIEGLPVTEIGDYAFHGGDLKSLLIPEGVTSLGRLAIASNYDLTAITLPSTLVSIDDGAFEWCLHLEEITIPALVEEIGDGVFANCTDLKQVNVAEGNTEYQSIDGALYDIAGETLLSHPHGKEAETYVFPDTITTIGDSAFFGSMYLTELDVPESVTLIDEWAFAHCESLTAVTLPSELTELSSFTFYGCSALPTLTIPETVTKIGGYVFDGCQSLTEITIPDSVTQIRLGAFNDCSSLTEITIPASVERFGEDALRSCTSLTSVTFENPNCQIDGSESTVSNGYEMDENFLTVYSYEGVIRGYEGSTAQAYAEECGYTFVSIGAAPEGTEPPEGTDSPEDNVYEGILHYQKYDSYVVITGCDDTVETVEIPAEIEGLPVTEIGAEAFDLHYKLKSVTIPDTVTVIGNAAFQNCLSLEHAELPAGVTTIGDSAFMSCGELVSCTIPDSVTAIGNAAFFYCESIPEIVIPASVTKIGLYAFYGCAAAETVSIPDTVTDITDGMFYACESLTEVVVPASVVEIGYAAFGDCTNLTKITIENPDCIINDTPGTIANRYAEDIPAEEIYFDGTIYGYANSTAQVYAETYGYAFEAIGEPTAEALPGDINGDGELTVADAVLLMRLAAEDDMLGYVQEITDQTWQNADLNGDGLITIADTEALLQKLSA